MDLERERRAHAILLEALARPPRDRRAHVLAVAEGDADLADAVLKLLAAEGELGDFLETPAAVELGAADAAPSEPDPAMPGRIGPYSILERLGSGGMGDVFRARQERPVRREVALKRIRTHLPEDLRARFFVEQQALARLGHSNVARLYDAGTTADGLPYFAMELIPGRPITAYCDENRLSVEERLRLFLGVCAGVEHAHQHQILHRDLKPSNVLVVEESGRPVPKVIDFGIAKPLEGSGTGLTLTTMAGRLVGTPAYMSPEALSPRLAEGGLDTRTDVYSLGVLLFELLTGRTPFGDGDPGLFELLGRVGEGRLTTPSRRLNRLGAEETGEVAESRSTTAPELLRRVKSDLDWIVAKAMAAERDRRYASVGELAADVERHLSDRPVVARPPSAAYRLTKLARRHRVAFLASVVALLGLVLGTSGLAIGFVEARHHEAATRRSLTESTEVSKFLVRLLVPPRSKSEEDDELSVRYLLDHGAEKLGSRLRGQPVARGRVLQTIGDVYVRMGRDEQAAPLLKQAETLLRASLPADDPAIASVVRSRGVLAFHEGRWKEAEALLRAGLEGLDPEQDAEDWALTVHNIGVALYSQGRFAEARAELLRARDEEKRLLPPDHPFVARTLDALGAATLAAGHPGQAATYYRQALDRLERTVGPTDESLGSPLLGLAKARRAAGDLAAAESLDRRALEVRLAGFPAGSRQVRDVRDEYAETLRLEGKAGEAKRILAGASG